MLNIKDLNHEDKIDQEAMKTIVGGTMLRVVYDAVLKVISGGNTVPVDPNDPCASESTNCTPQTETATVFPDFNQQ